MPTPGSTIGRRRRPGSSSASPAARPQQTEERLRMTKTIFITGATAGIGAASARRFAGAGWRVVGTGRRRERLDALAAELGEVFLPLEADVRDIAAMDGTVDALPERFRAVDLLLNNAGLAPPLDPLQQAELAPSV